MKPSSPKFSYKNKNFYVYNKIDLKIELFN